MPEQDLLGHCLQAFNLGATVVFADIEPDTLCLNPADLERCISPCTKAIMVVHYCGHPADMDPIMAIAKKHGISLSKTFLTLRADTTKAASWGQ
jgi:dTDP-4-amino-4,6-dideoxygalactose transaminase